MRFLRNGTDSKDSKIAFRQLFDRHGGLILGYCKRLVKDHALAEDVAQDVWMKVIQNAEKYEAKNQLRPWLLTIARNASFNVLRQKKKWLPLDSDQFMQEPSLEPDTLNALISGIDHQTLRSAIDALPLAQSTAISLMVIENLSYEEIAKAMAISTVAVKNHIHRGRSNLTRTYLSAPEKSR